MNFQEQAFSYFQYLLLHIFIHISVCSGLPCLSGKGLYRQVCVGALVISGNLNGVMINTLARNARDEGFDNHSRHNISHLHHPHNIYI